MPIRPDFETDEEWHAHLRIWLAGQALAAGAGPVRAIELADEMMQLLLWPTHPNGIA
jgi:hypothetical protein